MSILNKVNRPEGVAAPTRPHSAESISEETLKAGSRNNDLAKVAGQRRRIGDSAEEIFYYLWGMNALSDNPLPDHEVRAIAQSMMRYDPEISRPEFPEGFRLATLPEVAGMADDLGEEEWICGPIQGGTVGIIAAKQGVGKSMLALGMAWAISTGNSFASWETLAPKKVALIDVELSTRHISNRLNLYKWDPDTIRLDWQDWRDLHGVEHLLLGNPAHHKLLMEACADMDVIIIDNTTFCLENRKGETYADSWRRVLELMNWARGTGKTLIFIDHKTHSGTVAGSIDKERSVDWVLKLEGISLPGANPVMFDAEFAKVRYMAPRELTRKRIFTGHTGVWTDEILESEDEIFARLKSHGLNQESIQNEMEVKRTKYFELLARWRHVHTPRRNT